MPGIEEARTTSGAWRSPFAIVFYAVLLIANGGLFAFAAADSSWGALAMMIGGAPFVDIVLTLLFLLAALIARRAGARTPRWYVLAGIGIGSLIAVEAAIAALPLHGC